MKTVLFVFLALLTASGCSERRSVAPLPDASSEQSSPTSEGVAPESDRSQVPSASNQDG